MPITVLPVNDAPEIISYNGPESIAEDSEVVFSVFDFIISDPDGSDQIFSLSILEGDNYSLNSSGNGLIPDLNFNGVLSVVVVAKDQFDADSDIFQFELDVYAVNDAPVIKDLAIYPAVPTIDDNLTANFISEDVDGDILAMSIQWYKNEVIELSYTEETLPSSATARSSEICHQAWEDLSINKANASRL